MALNKSNIKIGDKVKVVTDTGLSHIKHKETFNNFKCVYCVIENIDATGCRVKMIDYKGKTYMIAHFKSSELIKLKNKK